MSLISNKETFLRMPLLPFSFFFEIQSHPKEILYLYSILSCVSTTISYDNLLNNAYLNLKEPGAVF